jgi:hypothetical protein
MNWRRNLGKARNMAEKIRAVAVEPELAILAKWAVGPNLAKWTIFMRLEWLKGTKALKRGHDDRSPLNRCTLANILLVGLSGGD